MTSPLRPSINANVRPRIVVRLERSHWHDDRGAYLRIGLRYLKRHGRGCNFLDEDCRMTGAEDVLPRIVNLHRCEDGVYELISINETTDWETGYVDDWQYKLIPYRVTEDEVTASRDERLLT